MATNDINYPCLPTYPPNPYINTLFPFIFISPFTFPISETPFPSQICSPSSPIMAKTHGAHSYRPRVRQSSTPHADTSTPGASAGPSAPAACPSTSAAASPAPATVQGTATADAEGSSFVAPAHRRYHTRVGPTPPAPSHPRPAQRAPLPKRARTSGPGESSTSRPRAPPSSPYQGIAGAPDLSPASIIRRPFFPYSPILGNVDFHGRDFHGEFYYDLLAFAEDSELRDSMLLVQRYHLEPFMAPRRYYYPRVVIEFYHTMTSRHEANPTALYFSIDGRPGILRASDITAALHFPVVLANAADDRQ